MNVKAFKMKKSFRGTILLLGSFLALYLAGYFLLGKSFVPNEFFEARSRSALVAKEIVALTDISVQNLDKISLQERKNNYPRALVLVKEELENSKKSRVKAADLAKEIGAMTEAAGGITPTKARNLATDAVRDEVALITHLIVYNDSLNSLLQILELTFSGVIPQGSEEVQTLIKNMNQEVKEINILNDLFNQKMREFDNLVS
ncbi:MAG: hypothetical protein HYY86_01115 [Candidatus Harrisonbacteria bacterium]|nr:hypothetical protein [Candidatus Harrisonbacteria bacterium]